MPDLSSRPDDCHPGSAETAFFAGHPGHIMIHHVRPLTTLAKNSKQSSRRNRLVARSSELFAVSQESPILSCASSPKSPCRGPPVPFRHLPTARSVGSPSDSSIKTHTSDAQQRFSPTHF